MTHEQEILVLQELQRHQQALEDIAAGKITQTTEEPENDKEKETNEFIKQMQELEKFRELKK